MSNFLTKLLGAGVVEPVAKAWQARTEAKSRERIRRMELEDALHGRQMDLAKQGLTADMQWENIFAQGALSSWKDEYELLILSAPLILCFIPYTQAATLRGFEILEQTPGWYRWMVVTIFLANYGIRFYRRRQYDTP